MNIGFAIERGAQRDIGARLKTDKLLGQEDRKRSGHSCFQSREKQVLHAGCRVIQFTQSN